ncbi:hypothetical protein BGY98DRAFT_626954 [Russula aff. rugulosa BPL654]|nr:hypothetical protein BGY98DRAFT_626954 [Russula aff. rugulosa BPL654]
MIGELKPRCLRLDLRRWGTGRAHRRKCPRRGGNVTGRLSPYVSRQVVKSAPFATYITRFGLTSEGDIWVTCFGVIMIHDLPTTMYFVFFFSFFSPYIALFIIRTGLNGDDGLLLYPQGWFNDGVLRAYFTVQRVGVASRRARLDAILDKRDLRSACGATPRPPLRRLSTQ